MFYRCDKGVGELDEGENEFYYYFRVVGFYFYFY